MKGKINSTIINTPCWKILLNLFFSPGFTEMFHKKIWKRQPRPVFPPDGCIFTSISPACFIPGAALRGPDPRAGCQQQLPLSRSPLRGNGGVFVSLLGGWFALVQKSNLGETLTLALYKMPYLAAVLKVKKGFLGNLLSEKMRPKLNLWKRGCHAEGGSHLLCRIPFYCCF